MGMIRRILRTGITGLGGLVVTVAAAIASMVAARSDPNNPTIQRIIDLWSDSWLRLAGVDLTVVGGENVDPGRSYVVVANHASTLDIMACFRALPIPVRFLAKKELFRIPLLAGAMRAIGIVEVDRQARVGIHEQLNTQASHLVATGRSVIIYPEGTRTRNGTLGPFKKGAFTIAVSSELPILPVAIHGSYDAWPPGPALVRGGEITVVIESPIETEGTGPAESGRLRDATRDIISKRLSALA